MTGWGVALAITFIFALATAAILARRRTYARQRFPSDSPSNPASSPDPPTGRGLELAFRQRSQMVEPADSLQMARPSHADRGPYLARRPVVHDAVRAELDDRARGIVTLDDVYDDEAGYEHD